jgi:hypothetical protein
MARSVFVGDVHGCARELEDLLAAVALTTSDRLIFVGDLVARGPDSRGVVELARRHGALGVVGNHEERLIEARRAQARGERGPRLGESHQRVLHELDPVDWRYIEALPRMLSLDEHGVLVVHAGVVPGVALDAQDPWLLTHLRSLEPDGTPTDKLRPRLWAASWSGPQHVVFGHNAVSGLQLEPWATGLDTGCVYGQRLTALLLDAGEPVPPVAERAARLVSVPAERAYFPL